MQLLVGRVRAPFVGDDSYRFPQHNDLSIQPSSSRVVHKS
ncbi:hypothetical protein ACO22_06201 [Paracoccidioides brasiliensis]|uniref:Uncharacterized protein n=1 Tax=Paracoccidioides brasiliensis TaxID=121759 RepID=A0A1D2J882_PARBR|nr:hypothetical protein ACO22_06201 [Paracoccidioides brasiliensis]